MSFQKRLLDFIAGDDFEVLKKDREKYDTKTYKITLMSCSTKNDAEMKNQEEIQTFFSVCDNLDLEVLTSGSWIESSSPYSFIPKLIIVVRGKLGNVRDFHKMLRKYSEVVTVINGG